MKLKLTIEMDNEAFADDGNDGRNEAARILAVVARKLEQGEDNCGCTIDHNGNTVGQWAVMGGGSAIRTIDIKTRYRPFRVTYHGPGERRGSRFTITDLRHNKRRILPYDHEQSNVSEMAFAHLTHIGIKVSAMALADKDGDCLLLSKDFKTPLT